MFHFNGTNFKLLCLVCHNHVALFTPPSWNVLFTFAFRHLMFVTSYCHLLLRTRTVRQLIRSETCLAVLLEQCGLCSAFPSAFHLLKNFTHISDFISNFRTLSACCSLLDFHKFSWPPFSVLS
jgi:hypothetical protein